MSKHTPTPWEVVHISDNPPSWNIWAEALEGEDRTLLYDITFEADARLIAAAPELLAACEAFDAAEQLTDLGAYLRALDALKPQMRAAIAKAKGGNDGKA